MEGETYTFDRYPLVSIITVNYNQAKVTCDLLESLKRITYPNIEVIVVDNHSVEDDPSIIKKQHPYIKYIENPINYGFAAGNNFGIMAAKGEYVLLINNDIEVPKDFLEPLVYLLEHDHKIGAVSPKIKYFYRSDTIQYAGYTPINPVTMRNFAIGYMEQDNGKYDDVRETAYGHGAAMMVPMRVIKEVGLMSYIFFLYYEEADWCARINNAGYKSYYSGKSYVLHKESVSTGKLSSLKTYYLNRNRIVFMRRNYEGRDFYLGIFYQLFIAIPKNAFKFLLKGKVHIFAAYYKAILWNLNHLYDDEIHENPML
jgi:GT2 family glycosyltransferase